MRFDLALEQKELETAESLQQIIRSENIDQCEGSLAMARLEMVKGNYQLALRRLDECESLRPLLSFTHYLRSEVQRQMEDEEGAIESAKRALSMDPQNASYARQLASLFFTRNTALGNKVTLEQRAEAERAVMMAIQLNPSDSQLQGVYSEIIKQRDPDQALLIRKRLLENDPSVSNAMMLGQLALEMAGSEWDAAKKTGLIELAGSAYQQGLEAEPDNQILRQAYADYQQKTGKEDAIEMLGGDKNLEWKFYLRNSQFEQAEAILKDLLQEQPDDPLLIRGLVFAFQGMGNRDRVRDYLEMLSGLDETKETELWVIQKYIDNGFSVEAEKKLESFQERYPEEKSILLIAAWTQMGKGQLDEALISVNRYLETNTTTAGAWRLRGRLYRLMNQPQKAIEDLQHSKEMKDDP
ncbi:MAG: tetratricopeptide repeat protein, partial [Planctomycetota bacterium]